MYGLRVTKQFKKDARRAKQRGKDLKKLEVLIDHLRKETLIDPKYLDHPLSGDMKGYRDCHIEPDWLLIYKIEDVTLVLVRTGSHPDLFD